MKSLTLFPAASGNGDVKTMSSREIAEYTGKAHHHVLVDVRNMLKGLGLCESDFRFTYDVPGPNGGGVIVKSGVCEGWPDQAASGC